MYLYVEPVEFYAGKTVYGIYSEGKMVASVTRDISTGSYRCGDKPAPAQLVSAIKDYLAKVHVQGDY